MKKIYLVIVLSILSLILFGQKNEENGKYQVTKVENKFVSMGVNFAKLVDCISEAKVNEKIELKLITGAVPVNIQYKRRSDDVIFEIDEDSTVTFTEPGVYGLVVLEYPQHISYDITITE